MTHERPPGLRHDDREPPVDVAHEVIDEGGNDTVGWRITGMPDDVRWAPRDWAEQMADTYEGQRLTEILRRMS